MLTRVGPDPPPNVTKSYFYFLRLNVKTFFTLLQVLQPELERLSGGDDVTQNGGHAPQLSDKITPVAKRVLPGLRLYSKWFTRFWHILNANIADTLTQVEVQELWKSYAATLTLITSSLPVAQLPSDSYMLEEDIETIGFQPLASSSSESASMKRSTDSNRGHPNIEMFMRVRNFLLDGIRLAQDPEVPLDHVGNRFVYREEGVPSELLASPHVDRSPPMSPELVDFPLFPPQAPIAEDQKSHSVVAPSESASTTIAMNRMVDDLVGPDDGQLDPLPEEDENIPPTPPEQTFEDTALVSDSGFAPPLTARELVNAYMYRKPATSPPPVASLLSTPMARVASSSSIRGPANLPSIPNTDAIWNRNYGTPGPASPLMPSSAEVRSSPANGLSGHVRGDSTASLRSTDFSTPSSMQRPIQGGLGSSTAWGNPTVSHYGSVYGNGNNVYGNGSAYSQYQGQYQGLYQQTTNTTDYGMASPLLFQSSYIDREHSSYGRTPPNGQVG